MFCSQPEDGDLCRSVQMVDVVFFSADVQTLAPRCPEATFQDCFASLYDRGSTGCSCLLPSLDRRSASSFPPIPQ